MIRRLALAAVLAALATTQAHADIWGDIADAFKNSPTQFHGGSSYRYTVVVYNPTANPIYYELNEQNFVLSPGQARWHSRDNNSNFGIEFDADFAPGNQIRGYRLIQGTHYHFSNNGSRLDLHRR